MKQKSDQEKGAEDFISTWMKSTLDFWKGLSAFQTDGTGMFDPFEKTPFSRFQKSFETGGKTMQSLFSILSRPENINSLMQGMDTFPEFVLSMTQQAWDGYIEVQKRLAEQAAKMGHHTEAYNFEDIEHSIFSTIRDIYEREFQKLFNVPAIGLSRFYQERMNRLVDKFNIYQTSLGELLYMFYAPVEKSNTVYQEKVEEMIESGQIMENARDYYNMWIRILEGHYMKLLQSEEYVNVMNNTIKSLVDYKKAREEVIFDVLKDVPIPTNRDMDELYKDFYELKKQVRELSRKLESSS